MSETFLTRQELLPHVYFSLMSWTQLQLLEVQEEVVMQEELVTESSINCSHKWTALEQKKTFSSLEQPTDHKS
jgi:hypothetical protein